MFNTTPPAELAAQAAATSVDATLSAHRVVVLASAKDPRAEEAFLLWARSEIETGRHADMAAAADTLAHNALSSGAYEPALDSIASWGAPSLRPGHPLAGSMVARAADLANLEGLSWLAARGHSVDVLDKRGFSLLFHACRFGRVGLVKLLLSLGALPDGAEPLTHEMESAHPLLAALEWRERASGVDEICELLLAAGARVEATMAGSAPRAMGALALATDHESRAAFDILLPAVLALPAPRRQLHLDHALLRASHLASGCGPNRGDAGRRLLDQARLLVNLGANPCQVLAMDFVAPSCAVWASIGPDYGSWEHFSLLTRGWDSKRLMGLGIGGDTLLHRAASFFREREMAALMARVEGSVDVRNEAGYTPLMLAAAKNIDEGACRALLRRADLSLEDASGRDALTLAALAPHCSWKLLTVLREGLAAALGLPPLGGLDEREAQRLARLPAAHRVAELSAWRDKLHIEQAAGGPTPIASGSAPRL